MARVVRLALALMFAGCGAIPAYAGDVAGWVDREVNAALAAPEHTSMVGCTDRGDLATAIDCEVNAALAPRIHATSSSNELASAPD